MSDKKTPEPTVTKLNDGNWYVSYPDVLTVAVPITKAASKAQAVAISKKALQEHLALNKKSK